MAELESPVQSRLKAARAKAAADKQVPSAATPLSPVQLRLKEARDKAARERQVLSSRPPVADDGCSGAAADAPRGDTGCDIDDAQEAHDSGGEAEADGAPAAACGDDDSPAAVPRRRKVWSSVCVVM